MLGHHLSLQRICILTHLSFCLILTEHLLSCAMLDWLYVLSVIDLFIVVFNSAIFALGNSILTALNGITFPSLPVSILYMFTLFWLVPNSKLLNITDFMLWNVKDSILVESELLLLSCHFGTGTSSSLCILCICLGCWDVGHACTHPLEHWHTAFKGFHFPHTFTFTWMLGTASGCVLHHIT